MTSSFKYLIFILEMCYIKINIKQNILLKIWLKIIFECKNFYILYSSWFQLFVLIKPCSGRTVFFFFKFLTMFLYNVSFPLQFTFPWLFCLFDYVASVLSIENPNHWFLVYNIKFIAIVYSFITLSHFCG